MRIISKHRLLKYEAELYQALNSNGIMYIMLIEVTWFWGLFKTNKKTKVNLPFHCDRDDTMKKWDELILNRRSLK